MQPDKVGAALGSGIAAFKGTVSREIEGLNFISIERF